MQSAHIAAELIWATCVAAPESAKSTKGGASGVMMVAVQNFVESLDERVHGNSENCYVKHIVRYIRRFSQVSENESHAPHPNMSAVESILDVQDLSFAYPGQARLVSHFSVCVGAGVTLMHGDTGSGKTTLLRVMAGALASQGALILKGVRLTQDPGAYKHDIFLCELTTQGFDQVSPRQCAASLGADDPRFVGSEWDALVQGFALTAHLDKPMYMLSTGSKHKVWLAAALASGRALILLDEPTGGLDAASINCLWSALGGFARRTDCAVVLASTDMTDRVTLAASIELPGPGT
jgi:ABC-2 type transport system ATP-binding protein